MRLGNLDISLLIGHILQDAWQGELNVISVVADPDQAAPARTFLEQVTDLARLPEARARVETGGLEEGIQRLPTADLAAPMSILAFDEGGGGSDRAVRRGGTLEPGTKADVVVGGNPLFDIHMPGRDTHVSRNGIVYKRKGVPSW